MSDRIAVMNEGRIEQVDSRQAVYEQPKTPLLLALWAKTIHFMVRSPQAITAGLKCYVMATNLLPISAAGIIRSQKADHRAKIILFVRPESISIKNSKTQTQNSFSAQIDSIEFEGHLQNLFLTTGSGMKVRLSVPNAAETSHLIAGQTMDLVFSAQKALVLPEGNLAVD